MLQPLGWLTRVDRPLARMLYRQPIATTNHTMAPDWAASLTMRRAGSIWA
jgi:hypothetical protein